MIKIFEPGDTRRKAAVRLESDGISGAAAEMLLNAGNYLRHAQRVAEAKAAAQAAAREILGENAGEKEVDVVVRFLGFLDAVGVGGCGGLEGISTSRLPIFRSLGKGRKFARDGGAWSAAIQEACGSFHGLPGLAVVPRGGKFTLLSQVAGEEEAEVVLDPANPALTQSLIWLWVVAAEGLRKSAGLEPANFFGQGPSGGLPAMASYLGEATAQEWAGLYNAVQAALDAEKEKRIAAEQSAAEEQAL